MSTHDRLGRRNALVGIGAAAAGVAVGVPLASRAVRPAGAGATGGAGAAAADVSAGSSPLLGGAVLPAPADDPVRALFGHLGEGSEVSSHWRLDKLNTVRAGAIPVIMSTIYGDRFALEIFADDAGGPSPIARAGALALYLVNEGDGASPTSELHGLGVMALGRELEARLDEGAPIPPGLDTYADRMARDPDGSFAVPLV